MKRGTLLFDPNIQRPVVRFADGAYSEPLACGDTLYLERQGGKTAVRLELDADDCWYYAGLPYKRLARLGDKVFCYI